MHIEPYNGFKHRRAMILALQETWNLHEEFVDAKNTTIIYDFFLKMALLSSCLAYVVVIDDKPVGLLAGMIKSQYRMSCKLRHYVQQHIFMVQAWFVIFTRQLGQPKSVRKYLSDLRKLEDHLGKDKVHHDASIELFYLHPSARGKGAGKALMDHYVERCRSCGVKSILLWTDIHCNYAFYDKYGFVRKYAIYSPLLGEEKCKNGFVYAYTL